MSFREDIGNPRIWPGWILGSEGRKFVRVLGIAHDRFMDSIYLKRRANMPSFAPSDEILGEIARDRDRLIFPGESRASKENRLIKWRSTHRARGTGAGLNRETQPLWLPEMPTQRIVAGNSQRATWYTVYGNDAALAVDQTRWDLLVDPLFPRPVAGGFSYTRAEPSNWDWYSEYFTLTSIPEPPKLFRFWCITYAPPSVTYHDEDLDEEPNVSLNSSVTTEFEYSVSAALANWGKAGSAPWGWILASDPASFDPAGSNVTVPGGYPDGTWWNATSDLGFNRLDTAEYYNDRLPFIS